MNYFLRIAGVFGVLAAATAATNAAQPFGGFFVHINQNQNFSDSRRSVTYYSDQDMSDPLFSVHIPGEFRGDLNYNYEELDSIAVDPVTGDTYVVGFDSGAPGALEDDGQGAFDHTGDLDIYRIDFRSAYDHWSSTFQGNVASSIAGVEGPLPTTPAGASAGSRDDYVTYGIGPLFDDGGVLHFNNASPGGHSNIFVLDGVVQKIAEVKRSEGEGFFDRSLEFIDSNTLILLDDSSVEDASESAATDHSYRLIERVSTSPGFADDSTADDGDGGYNNGTTESWNSRIIGRVNQDFAGGAPSGHSEPESIAYHEDLLTGVRGIWVTESDGGGDDIAFFDIDSQSYREHAVGGGPEFPTSFALDNDPFNNSSSNDGKAEHIFVDADTGDLIIVESGFGDAADGIEDTDHEPAVIRREVLSYDDGAGRIQFGAWSEKIITTPAKDPGDTFLERGHWSAYDSENDLVYFINAGGSGETPSFEADIMVLDVNTGVTMNYLNIDDSVSLFFGSSFGDVADFFYLEDASGLPGDFNGDGLVDSADYTVWRDNLGAADESALNGNGDGGGVTSSDYDLWVASYGTSSSSLGADAVPTPGAIALAAIAVPMLSRRRRV